MKTLAVVAIVALAYCLPGAKAAPTPTSRAEKFTLDPVHSFALFKIKHLGIGYSWGRINNPTGTIEVDEADPSKSSVSVELKAENVDTANGPRDQHLKGPDFFNSKQHPTITFKSKSVKKAGDAKVDVVGDFTLLGVTKEITVSMTRTGGGKHPMGGTAVGFEGTVTVKRSDYGMKFSLDNIGDEVQIFLAFEAIHK